MKRDRMCPNVQKFVASKRKMLNLPASLDSSLNCIAVCVSYEVALIS